MTVLSILDDLRPVTPLRLTDPIFDTADRLGMWDAVDAIHRDAYNAPYFLRKVAGRIAAIGEPRVEVAA